MPNWFGWRSARALAEPRRNRRCEVLRAENGAVVFNEGMLVPKIVSVMLPTFERHAGGYLQRAIESVLGQSYPHFELLVVDDGSTDGSAELIKAFSRKDARVRHIRHERNVGLPALTLGLAYAKAIGERIAFIFDDCVWDPSHLEALVATLDANPLAAMAYGQAEAASDAVGTMILGRPFDPNDMRAGNNHIPNVSVMLTRAAIATYGWYDPHVLLKRFCDWDLWCRIGRNSPPVYVPRVLAREEGTRLANSLGHRVTVFTDLMLRYAATDRDRALAPERLQAYDPFLIEVLPDLSGDDRRNLEYLVCEHFLAVGRGGELLARPEHKNADSVADLRNRYLEQRLQIVSSERNTMQHALLSLEQGMRTIAQEARDANQNLARERSLTTAANERLHQVLDSTSWRVTRPLRGISRLFRGQIPLRSIAKRGGAIASTVARVGRLLEKNNLMPRLIGEQVVSTRHGRPIQIIAIGDATASTDMCVRMPLEWMSRQFGMAYALYDQHQPPPAEVLRGIDILILMRCHTHACLDIVEQAKHDGAAVFYMTDDDLESLVCSEPGSPQLAALINNLRKSGATDNVRALADASDRAFVFSKALKERFSPLVETKIAPAFAGVELYDALGPAVRSPQERDEIRVGYAGSLSHDRDVAAVIPVLERLLKKYPRLVVETIGQRFNGALATHPRYRAFDHISGLPDYIALQHSRSWDIGLAPLEITPFNEAKSDNKYRFYGAAGIPAVYTRFASFAASVTDGKTGLLVSNEESAWEAALERLISDADLRQRIAHAAKTDVRQRFGLSTVALHYMRWFSELNATVRVLGASFLHLPTVHIDLRLPFAEMRRQGKIFYRLRSLHETTSADLDWADVLVVVRAADPETEALVRDAKARGVKVIFSWDDDFFNIPKEHSDLHAYYSRTEIKVALEFILRSADLVKASTKPIAERSAQYNKNVMIAPYGFDFSLLPTELLSRADNRIRIGYFGSVGRGSEFDCVMEALCRLCEKHANVDLEFFGFAPKDMGAIPRVTFFPFSVDYEGSIAALAQRQWDIGLAPLADNALNRAKLPTKYRDYGATRAAGVYSDIESYRSAIQDGRTGLLVKNSAEAWFEALERLVLAPALRKSISEAAFQDVHDNLSLDTAVGAWTEAFDLVHWTMV